MKTHVSESWDLNHNGKACDAFTKDAYVTSYQRSLSTCCFSALESETLENTFVDMVKIQEFEAVGLQYVHPNITYGQDNSGLLVSAKFLLILLAFTHLDPHFIHN
jgi:hypothetical protein